MFIMCYFIKIKNEHIGDGSEKILGVYPLYFFLMWTLERILFTIMKVSLRVLHFHAEGVVKKVVKYLFKILTNILSAKCWIVFSDIHCYFIFTSTNEYTSIQMNLVTEVDLSSFLVVLCEC